MKEQERKEQASLPVLATYVIRTENKGVLATWDIRSGNRQMHAIERLNEPDCQSM